MKFAFLFLSFLSTFANGEDPFEWEGAFELTAGENYRWRAQKTGCPRDQAEYVDPSMILVLYPIDNGTEAALDKVHGEVETLFGSTTDLEVNGATGIQPSVGHKLIFDQNSLESYYALSVSTTGFYGIYAEHVPTEFEFDAHYLIDGSDEDVEPIPMDEGEGGHDHGHAHGGGECVAPTSNPDCSCTIAGDNFNCDNTAFLQAQMDFLVENKCNESCNCYETGCRDAFWIVDMHHEACNADQLPQDIEEMYHDYDSSCQLCYQAAYQNPALGACEPFDCADSESAIANYTYLTDNCLAGECDDTDECRKAWNRVIAQHDACCFSDVPAVIEEGFHDLETQCKGGCNIPNAEDTEGYVVDCTATKNVGIKTETKDDDDDGLSTGETVGVAVVCSIVGAAIIFAAIYFTCLKPNVESKTRKAPQPLEEPQKMEGPSTGMSQPNIKV